MDGAALNFFKKNITILIGINFSNFIQKNYTLPFLNNAINSFESNVISTNVFTTFIQTIKVTNSYWFIHLHHFLLINNHSTH